MVNSVLIRNSKAICMLLMTIMHINVGYMSQDNWLERSNECFTESIPILVGIQDDFVSNYLKCSLDLEVKPNHLQDTRIIKQTQSTDPTLFLDYDQGGYTDRHLFEVKKCQNATERKYVENTAKTFKELQVCLKTVSDSDLTTTTGDDKTSTTDSMGSSPSSATTIGDDKTSTTPSMGSPPSSATTIGDDKTSTTQNMGSPSSSDITTTIDHHTPTTQKIESATQGGGANSIRGTNVLSYLLAVNLLILIFNITILNNF